MQTTLPGTDSDRKAAAPQGDGPVIRRVLLLDPSLFSPLYAQHFASGMRAFGTEVVLATRRLRGYETLARDHLDVRPVFYRLTERGGGRWRTSRTVKILKALEHPLGWRAVRELVSRLEIGVIHVSWSLVPAIDSAFLAGLKERAGIFMTVHNADLVAHDMAAVSGRLGRWTQSWRRERLLALIDGFVAHTDQAVDSLSRLGIEPSRIRLVRRPPYRLRPDGAVGPRSRAEAGRPVEILFFGAIKPYKGLDLLLDSALALAAQGKDFRVTVAGRPFLDLAPWRTRIEEAGLGERFRFDLDYVPDERLDRYLRDADIVVFPYREIDGSGALALAASYGGAIVASAVGVFAEPPVRDHVALVPAEDVEALTATLRRLIVDPEARAELASKSAVLAERLGDWRDYARACLDFYRQRTEGRSLRG